MWARELKPETILVSGVQKERRSLVYPLLDVPETFFTDQRREEKKGIKASMSSRTCLTVGELNL